MSVVVAMEDVGPCRKQLTVEVPAPAVEAETQRIVVEFSRQVRLPGFRKGKVPRRLIEQRFRDDIQREVIDRLVPRYWQQAEAESQLKPILEPQVENVDLKDGAPLTFVATVEVRPEIELDNLGDFDLPESDPTPTPDELDEAVEGLRIELADWVPVERPAATGDMVTVRMEELAGDEEGEERTLSVEVGDPRIWEELSLALTGATEGQVVEFTRSGIEKGEKEARYRLKVLEVEERELPPLDDSLAAKAGDYEDLEALREALRKKLQAAKKKDLRASREKALLEQLRQRYPVELPQRAVDQEVHRLLKEQVRSIERSGVDLERVDVDWQRLAQDNRPLAENRVHSRLLLEAAAEAEGLRVTEEELQSMLAAIARAQKQTTVAVRQALDASGRLGALRGQMLQQKTLRHLLGEDAADDPLDEAELGAEA